jgi:hypothetical protein
MQTQLTSLSDRTLSWRMLRLVYMDNISFGGRITDLLDIVEAGQSSKQVSLDKKYDDLLSLIQSRGMTEDELDSVRLILDQHKEISIKNISATIIASALVLSHSHLDHSLNRLLTVSVYTNWPSWAYHVLRNDNARYTLAEALQLDSKKEKNRATLAFLRRLEQKSVCERNQTLLARVGRFATASSERRIPASDLKTFDHARHGVIHKNHVTRASFTEEAPQDFKSIFGHVENLCQSVCEACGFDWENLTDPVFEDEPK